MKSDELKALEVLSRRMSTRTKTLLLTDLAPQKAQKQMQIERLTEQTEKLLAACLTAARKGRWRNVLAAAEALGIDLEQ